METFDIDVSFPGEARVDAEIDGVQVHTGGEDEPSPFDLFLASIGTCSGIKVLRFCQDRGIPTADLRLIQRMHYNPESRMIEKIELAIHLPADFPAQYHEAVVRAANTCGVKKHLASPPVFDVFVTSD